MLRFSTFLELLNEGGLVADGPETSTHSGTIDGHHVKVKFDHDPTEDSHMVSFYINGKEHGSDLQNPLPDETKMKILHHVQNTVSNYIENKSPGTVWFMANDTSKMGLYHKFANKLAMKHGGHVSPNLAASPIQIIRFPKNKKRP